MLLRHLLYLFIIFYRSSVSTIQHNRGHIAPHSILTFKFIYPCIILSLEPSESFPKMATNQDLSKDKFYATAFTVEVSNDDERKKTWSRKRDLSLAFAMLFLPMMGIPLILLAFVLYTHKHPVFGAKGSTELPVWYFNSNGSYYTFIQVGAFTLVGSWASTAAQFVMAPVMLLFSFLIARGYSVDSRNRGIDQNAMTIAEVQSSLQSIAEEQQHHLDEVSKGISKAAWKDVLEGVKVIVAPNNQFPKSHALQVATVGGIISALFT
jgi:hypothetical protein